MSAIVCGKRSNSIFEELHHTSPPSSKRIRCSSTSPVRLSPTSSPSSVNWNWNLMQLRSVFPDMEQEILERALEASNDDLDSAIKSLDELRLGSSEINTVSTGKFDTGTESFEQASEVFSNIDSEDAPPSGSPSLVESNPTQGAEWVELLVTEMMNASDVDDARARASRVLGMLEKSIVAHASAEAVHSFHEENLVLKEQVDALLRENSILKRAVAIQHERQKEYDERSHELQHLKQLVSQYQEQLRTLEINNYTLMMHLRQAQGSSSIPGRFNPDVF